MKIYASVLAVTIAVVAGMSGADAAGRGAAHLVTAQSSRVSVGERPGRPQRPGMSPRDGDYSWCDDSGGGLECGIHVCDEYQSISASWCESVAWNDGSVPAP